MADTCTIWVCQDCMLHHANGECGNCHGHDEYTELQNHDREPLGLVDRPMSGYDMITMGMLNSEHAEDCPRRTGSYIDFCDCEIMNFTWQSCEGCGSTLAGGRHAMTLWFD